MKRTTKYLIAAILVLAAPSMLFASFEAWLGMGLQGGKSYVTEETREFYPTYASSAIPLDQIKSIDEIGPCIDLSLFPDYSIPVGIKVSNAFMLPIGVNSKQSFRSMELDFTWRLKAGVDYEQCYNDKFGLFAGLGFEYRFTRISKTNAWNSALKPEYNTFDNWGLYGELGLLTTIEHGYFRFGVDFWHSLQDEGMSHSLLFAGGYRF